MIILPHKDLPFNSAEIEVSTLPINDTSEFTTSMWTTINALKKSGKTAIFLKINLLYSHYAMVAGMLGFRYHHAVDDMATMLLWLPDSECKVPPFSTHHVGVAGAIVHDDKLLVVKETHKGAQWKLPGGYVSLGEDLDVAASREVLEETGVKSQFDSVLTVRHQHNVQFGQSDIYVICRMNALSTDIIVDQEIDDAKWMALEEFQRDTTHPMLEVVVHMLLHRQEGLQESTMKSTVPGRTRPFKLYHPKLK